MEILVIYLLEKVSIVSTDAGKTIIINRFTDILPEIFLLMDNLFFHTHERVCENKFIRRSQLL